MIVPTKSNLMATRRSLELARLGFDLLDRKRNIMMREMMALMDDATEIQAQIGAAFAEAYAALIEANMSIGQNAVTHISESIDIADDITLRYRSVMGVELPDLRLDPPSTTLPYGFTSTNAQLDAAYIKFHRVKVLTVKAAAVENSVYRLAYAIKQAKKRANALRNIVIPQLEETVRYIASYLEEKERDEFTSLKVIKGRKEE